MRFFLGIHKFSPIAATNFEMDWLGCREKRWLNMIRLYNRINVMPLSRLPKIINDWDVTSGASSWSSEARHIVHKLYLDPDLEWGDIYDLTVVNNKLLEMSRLSWNLESFQKPKLRTFVKVHDFDSYQAIVKSPLTRTQWSKLIQLKFGILPLKYETDRYQGIAPERRLCELCTLNVPEDEIHFLFQCPAFFTTRVKCLQRFSEDHLEFGDDHIENMSNLLKKEHIVSMALFTESLYKERQSIMYMWFSLKWANDQHCPHCSLPLSFISVLFHYIFIIIFILVLDTLELNYMNILSCMPMYAFALAQTVTTHIYSLKWIKTCTCRP